MCGDNVYIFTDKNCAKSLCAEMNNLSHIVEEITSLQSHEGKLYGMKENLETLSNNVNKKRTTSKRDLCLSTFRGRARSTGYMHGGLEAFPLLRQIRVTDPDSITHDEFYEKYPSIGTSSFVKSYFGSPSQVVLPTSMESRKAKATENSAEEGHPVDVVLTLSEECREAVRVFLSRRGVGVTQPENEDLLPHMNESTTNDGKIVTMMPIVLSGNVRLSEIEICCPYCLGTFYLGTRGDCTNCRCCGAGSSKPRGISILFQQNVVTNNNSGLLEE